MDRVDCIVIGAGVIGLTCARALAIGGREVVILEAAEAIGTGTSSRHSEVVHAGIYYQPGSLKARFCVEGKHLLYRYMADHGVPHARIGKLIVANNADQIPALQRIKEQAAANGVEDLEFISHNRIREIEPELNCIIALQSPSTGILDTHAYMLALQGDAEDHGAMLACHAPVGRGTVAAGGIILEVGGAEPMQLQAGTVINAAGLHAQTLAQRIEGFPREKVPPAHFCKGSYYTLSGCRAPFSQLIYPAPEAAGLGIHLTLDLAGQARFGPDVEWIEAIDYDVDAARADSFYAAVRNYWPGLPDGALQPGYAGIRPKIQALGEPAHDFVIQGPADHGIQGLVNLFAIESPGVTASLAIAAHVEALLDGAG